MAEKEKRLVQHNFKTTESEARIIRKKMEALGITNESAYMRALALNGYILKLDLPQIREMIRLLSNMTNNLNQIARRLNAQGQMYDTEMEEMLQKQDELWQMMRKLLSILERKFIFSGEYGELTCFYAHRGLYSNPTMALVRMRSPVQIRSSAPVKAVIP